MSDPICTRILFESRGLPSPCRCPRCAAERERAISPKEARARGGKILAGALAFLKRLFARTG